MTMEKLNLQAVVDRDRGFELCRISRSSLQYSENDHILLIEVEAGEDHDGKYNLAVYWPSSLKWQPPNDHVLISSAKRQEIIDRVDSALKMLEIPTISLMVT